MEAKDGVRNHLRRPGTVTRRVRQLGAAMVALVLLLTTGNVAATTLPDAFFGAWRAEGTPVRAVTIEREAEGFRARVRFGDGDRLDVAFVPAARPEVFAAVQSRGFFAMFSFSRSKGPLETGQFDWARLTDGRLYIYRLRFADDGSFLLDRLAIRREGEDLSVTLQRRRHASAPVVTHIRLAPAP